MARGGRKGGLENEEIGCARIGIISPDFKLKALRVDNEDLKNDLKRLNAHRSLDGITTHSSQLEKLLEKDD